MRRLIILLAFLIVASTAHAGEPQPLGIELGASVAEVTKTFHNHQLRDKGTNAYSNGPMLQMDGTGLDIDGLQTVLFVFDGESKMTALMMTMDAGGMGKGNFEKVQSFLRKSYPLKSSDNPFVGNKHAVFETAASRIELDAPHMSFDLTVTYMTKVFFKAFREARQAEEKNKEQSEGSRF